MEAFDNNLMIENNFLKDYENRLRLISCSSSKKASKILNEHENLI
jgi:hypothetical protein